MYQVVYEIVWYIRRMVEYVQCNNTFTELTYIGLGHHYVVGDGKEMHLRRLLTMLKFVYCVSIKLRLCVY